MIRRIALSATAAALAFGSVVALAGPAGAAVTPVNASGTANCSVSGKAKINPPLTNAVVLRTITVKATLSGCTGTSGVTSGKATLTETSASPSNGCTGLASGLNSVSGSIKWKGATKYNLSAISFSNGESTLGANIGFRLPSNGPTPAAGTSTFGAGSFAGEHAVATATLDLNLAGFLAACPGPKGKGIKKLAFTGLLGPSTFNITTGGV